MTDIVDWLRSYEASRIAKQTSEAADTIEALRAENARLREDLARMFEELPETTWTSKDVAYVIRNYTARTAMGESDDYAR